MNPSVNLHKPLTSRAARPLFLLSSPSCEALASLCGLCVSALISALICHSAVYPHAPAHTSRAARPLFLLSSLSGAR